MNDAAHTGAATPARPATHAALDLEHFLPYRLSVLSNRISQTIAQTYAERFNLVITEWRVIAVLGRHPGLSANGVAERTAMDKVAVSRTIARLLERGLVQRDIHGDDRRRSVLELSEAGYAIYDEVVPLAQAWEQALLAHFSDEDRRQLDDLLSKLGQGLERLTGQGLPED
ncbi:MAG: winged helix-turn-helix transcriptional regulator [Lysobacter sp.]|nr:winged helix-turn-helix transcriptional regulator [Lysobacter sp.]